MREIHMSGSMRGGRKRAFARRACLLLYDSPPAVGVLVFRESIGAVGEWETWFWFSTFPSALVAGAVGMWESRL